VIKIEDPDQGDYMRWSPPLVDGQSVMFNAVNRNKRSVSLNLKSAAGRDLLLRLVEGADVLVEGNRPGVMKRLGLAWDVIHARNPRLVMCSITGYGQDGPFAARAGHDLNYMATAGGLGLNGEKGRPPEPLSVQVADIGGGGLQPAVAILGALVAVQRGSEGRWLDVSMTDGAVSWLALALAAQGAGEDVRRGDQRLSGRYACYRVYACNDGGFYSPNSGLRSASRSSGPSWSRSSSPKGRRGRCCTARWKPCSPCGPDPNGRLRWPAWRSAASRCWSWTRWRHIRRSQRAG
jgi:crotonobetainyl-CoA:carnitine CoA-transferase CaiB-like acyl-CoA transferase